MTARTDLTESYARTDTMDENGWGGEPEPGRERGARRRKVYGYLKAANELRQAYAAQWAQKNQYYDDNMRDTPGGFPDIEAARSGEEEMVIFPSYGRRHVRRQPKVDYRQVNWDRDVDPDDPQYIGNREYWKREWDKYEQDCAVVDVDVRGWLYTPHSGPMNRKNRILIALARRMSGIPAPAAGGGDSRDSDRPPHLQTRLETHSAREEQDLVEKQAENIVEKGRWGGDPELRTPPQRDQQDGLSSFKDGGDVGQESSLSQDEIAAANAQLMDRLRPFLTNPLTSVPITVFFFNDKMSQSRTVSTNDGGHFSIRAALDFVPTQIRVLASENLSATEEVKIIEPRGISMISDIDDTIKHSAIASGTKEIFRNVFVRSLGDLKVLGVKEWYSKMASMGVRMHYVSNSPWQLYPLLKSFFSLAGLPPGSFHLKQYSGMLQGVLEPTTEKKRPTLERILLDFPDRRFILVGDSGEADLEIYTDLVLANPGRILGIFIRDVTTPAQGGFFDKSVAHLERTPTRASDTGPADNSDAVQNRPTLPPRRQKESINDDTEDTIGDLIDLEVDESSGPSKTATPSLGDHSNARQRPPSKPLKPAALQAMSTEPIDSSNEEIKPAIRRKPAPPLPEKPSQLSTSKIEPTTQQPVRSQTAPNSNPDSYSYATTVRNKVNNIYNQLPSAKSYLESASQFNPLSNEPPSPSGQKRPPAPPPPRRSTIQSSRSAPDTPPSSRPTKPSSLKAAATTPSTPSSTPRTHTPQPRHQSPTPASTSSSYTNSFASQPTVLNKREETWKRRWARARDILDRQGVVLSSWREGEDVRDRCVRLVERAQREMDGDK